MIVLDIIMLFIPPLVAEYLYVRMNRGNVGIKRSIIQFIGYFVIVNGASYMASYMRGVKTISFTHMTISYRMKYFLVGCLTAVVFSLFFQMLKRNLYIFKHLKIDMICFKKDMVKYFRYAFRLARADLKTEVANSYLDWLWWLIEPFCMMLIYAFVYGVVFRATEEYFTAFIYIGLTIWSFFSRNLLASVSMVRVNKAIISKIYIPKYILLFSKMLVNGFKMLVSMGIIVIMMAVYRVQVTINILYIIPIMIDLFLVTFAFGLILMHYGVFVKDLSYVTEILLRMLMYMTGTFYSVAKRVPAPYGVIIEKVNPIAYLIAGMRDALLYGKATSWGLLLLWAGISLLIIALGISTIYRNENSYVKVI